ncbi:MAG: tRNA uridine-5-carboxymethylaminomethyl(34) synthesis GTPase MnmE [Solobacterium sp.]|nr:tRNA uridine-5-carboxymethylaminomethyl(34) synthesis GTPase MnmE [Solobacterium sp.]
MFTDTIAAIGTPPGKGAISMIRISGEESLDVLQKVFDRPLDDAEGYTVHYGRILDGQEAVDEVLVNIYHAPRSYTGEDMVEIMCHGGVFVTNRVLGLCLSSGARMARNGEFTERAFLNGKMDLAQAEAVNDLINARDNINARSALHSLQGSVRKILDPLIEDLTGILAQIEANIDYPEYEDIQELTSEEILPMAERWLDRIEEVIHTAEQSILIRSGIDTAIVGKPNVGKSSLLNALLEEDKAIVTEIAGTTRDLVEGSVRIGNVTLTLIDTAGIHEAGDRIEEMGIERSLKALERAQLVLLVLDAERGLDAEDEALLEMTAHKDRIILYNKKDRKEIPDALSVSALLGDIDDLRRAIAEKYAEELYAAEQDTFNNERQLALARSARTSVQEAVKAMKAGMETDLVTIDLESAWNDLKEITGEGGREVLLDEIFSRFCLGK